jgi:hypothetical protein
LDTLIFFIYLVASAAMFYFLGVHRNTGLSAGTVISLFVLKVFAGWINLQVHYKEYITNDVYFYYKQSMHEISRFPENPTAFLMDLLFNWGGISTHLNFLDRANMVYWTDLGVLLHTKYMNIANLLTMGSLPADIVLFNIIFFLGMLQLYKVFYQVQPQKKWLYVVSVFLIPSVLFWCSGIHKDGWILAAIGFICYASYQCFVQKQRRYILAVIISLLLLFMMRYFVFLCFLPGYLLWIAFHQHPKRLFLFAISYILVLVLFFTIGDFMPFKPLDIIVAKQEGFLAAKGYSDMQTPKLYPTFQSFFANASTAFNHIFLRPYPSLSSPLKYQLSALDAWLVSAVMLCCLFYIKRSHFNNLFYGMLITFAFIMYMFIGYTTPNCGALVRYKSEFTAVLLSALLAVSEVPF